MKRPAILVAFLTIALAAALAPADRTAEAQPVCFQETGFCISNPAFLNYFTARGGSKTFGFPISREFTFLGFRVQFFQGHIMQLQPNGGVATMNLLDPGLMPVSHVNGSSFPPQDPGLIGATPPATDLPRLLDFIRANAPEDSNGQPVHYFSTFANTVPTEALAGTAPELRLGFNLEIWGSVTSRPMVEPTNAGFIYQRFQRSIMHYRSECRCTERILLADWFKTVIVGTAPGDLAGEMAGTPFINQWNPSGTRWLNRPDQLTTTDLTNAFAPELPGFTPPAAAGGAPAPSGPTATPMPSAGGLNLTLRLSDTRINPGETFTITLEATSDKGVDSMWWWATDTSDDNLRNTHTFDCNGASPCRNSWDQSTEDTGTMTIHGQARDRAGQQSEELTADLRVREVNATPTPTTGATLTPTTGATPTNTPGP